MEKVRIIAILGKSGAGKTFIANVFKDNGIPPVKSCTTRPRRTPDEDAHVFLSEEEFDKIDNAIAATVYGDYRYCGILEGYYKTYTYVIDKVGLETLQKDPRFDIYTIHVSAPANKRRQWTDPRRYDRDKDEKYPINFNCRIKNNGSLLELKQKVLTLVETLKRLNT
jgi:guanylate kinase